MRGRGLNTYSEFNIEYGRNYSVLLNDADWNMARGRKYCFALSTASLCIDKHRFDLSTYICKKEF